MIAALLPIFSRWWPLAVALVAFAAGWQVNGWRYEARHASELEAAAQARIEAEQQANAKSAALEAELATLRQNNRELSRRTSHETRKESYRCPLPADGLSLFNAVRTGNATGEPNH